MLYMRCGLIMVTLMVAPNHIALYKSPLPPGDSDSYNRSTCHPCVEKLGHTVARFHTQNGISIASAVFAGLTAVTNRQADDTTSVTTQMLLAVSNKCNFHCFCDKCEADVTVAPSSHSYISVMLTKLQILRKLVGKDQCN